ncbi:PolC-type DNA polymerase III [Hymenobacter sp. BT559]|uniref:3'-5' exonuclease n=1 Tax=Hymenobacter sp. BT559 TaxID=2795729 RepID=UPI0018EA5129|nr:3'-5' exonuclease [Hymenobacter sp. BT559]MBJ6145718.1 3'-5' exonuclease [Hymenobacter sp. BT559]
MSSQAFYFLLQETMSHSKYSWRREYLKLSLGKKLRLEKVVEYEDKTIYRPTKLSFGLPFGCVLSTKAEYVGALLRFRKDAADRKRLAELEKLLRKETDQKMEKARGVGAAFGASPLRVATTPALVPAANLFDDFTIVDTEFQDKHLLEIAAIRYQNWEPVDQMVSCVRFREWVAPRTTQLTGLTADMLHSAPLEKTVLQAFAKLAGGSLLIAHNIGADRSQIERARQRQGAEADLPNKWFCTMALAKARLPKGTKCGLGELCDRFGFSRRGHHQALTDVQMCFQILRHFHQEAALTSLDPKARKAAPTLDFAA